MSEHRQKPDGNLIFALDIGTRSVIGVVGTVEDGAINILAVETLEHTGRAVVDGQIEDIEQTARVAGVVKERLEARIGFELGEVHVAAAGRVLRTRKSHNEMEFDDQRPIEQQQLQEMETLAIQSAYEELLAEIGEEDGVAYYCVGHSVTGYLLDGYTFSTLLGHRGRKAQVELISTFLPSEVVESLYATMGRIGLSTASVTLEPIAAMNAVIPKELRLLNVALVDVGAGTSDIALAAGGSVSAYTMATMAGDEITEQIMREFLVDFGMAEQMKHMAGDGKQNIPYTDILGFENTVPVQQLLEKILPAVEGLAQTISERILDANGAPPMAVFMVGGGSRTPGLCPLVARGLGIDEKKVAIGGNNYMKRMVHTEPEFINAEYATPIGIAITAMSARSQEDLSVTLNGKRVRMQNSQSMTVIEALLRGGYQYSQIIGRSGKSVTFELCGERQVARGEMPQIAVIEVNGKTASITTPLSAGDEINFRPAVSGKDAEPCLRDVVSGWEEPFEVQLNGSTRHAGMIVTVNGAVSGGNRRIAQADKVQVRSLLTVAELLEEERLNPRQNRVLVNGTDCDSPDRPLCAGDKLVVLVGVARAEKPEAVVQPHSPVHRAEPTAAHIPVREEPEPQPAVPEGRWMEIQLNGSVQRLPPKADGLPYQFFDILNYTDIDPSKPQGNIALIRNGREASYLEPVLAGDRIEIYWEKK